MGIAVLRPPPGGYRCVGLVSKLPSGPLTTEPGRPFQKLSMTILARLSVGRILLHLVAMLGDRCVRFHFEGIGRELPWLASRLAMLIHAHSRLLAALTLYLAQPIKHSIADPSTDPQSLAGVLKRGDVLLTHGNSRFAALIKCVTRSPWSHVSMYVGPLDDGPDPLCVVEADIVAGVRSIRLSELNALQLRVLRPVGLTDTDRRRLSDWVVGQIGSKYDLGHAWGLTRNVLRLRLPVRFRSTPGTIARSAKRFVCCSLLAHAFAWIGYPILPDQMTGSPAAAAVDPASLIPGDFERASIFEAVGGK
jgi:Permuted papain-like amidase enzyme, YaeF/YiiX, C92 family